ncbi:MAG: hypothetical protein KKC71_09210 [Chloroflexi bacterium]|nr:hypothetical protein [Chloroflexota bacterium]
MSPLKKLSFFPKDIGTMQRKGAKPQRILSSTSRKFIETPFGFVFLKQLLFFLASSRLRVKDFAFCSGVLKRNPPKA